MSVTAKQIAALSAKQLTMLADYGRDIEATDICDFNGKLGWHNRERVINALHRKGLLDDNGITDAGRAVLAAIAPAVRT